jgi:phosphate-selective porin OprO/OprP
VLQYKNFHLQSEFIQANVKRLDDSNLEDATFMGGYSYLSWLVTGEKRAWSITDGEFGQVMPKNKKTGAWELAARYSHLNLTDEDADVWGGEGNLYTFGVNWYANPNMKIQLSYTIADLDANANSDGDYGFDTNAFDDHYDDGYDHSFIQFLTVIYF